MFLAGDALGAFFAGIVLDFVPSNVAANVVSASFAAIAGAAVFIELKSTDRSAAL